MRACSPVWAAISSATDFSPPRSISHAGDARLRGLADVRRPLQQAARARGEHVCELVQQRGEVLRQEAMPVLYLRELTAGAGQTLA